jgi:para-aminobenzoate synthetase/4-amino-4-deoxychorismate lyase
MIVDLLRNDLGRISQTGTVQTPKLFEIETHPTLHQMTSTVTSHLIRGCTYTDIFKSIFPCGSVTGAPKIRTMNIIRQLEHGNREVYCGALGYISPQKRAVFSVPIRTLQRRSSSKTWRYRVGSGIVADSSPESEWKECDTKCRLLVQHEKNGFELIESFLWNKRLHYKSLHRQRLQRSAEQLGFSFDIHRYNHCISSIYSALRAHPPAKVRILLNRNGTIQWEWTPLSLAAPRQRPRVVLADTPVDEREQLLFHKTTHRPWYDQAMDKIAHHECFDVIHYNSKNEITEGARTNVFFSIGGVLYTPPVRCGLLPGTLRAHLLKRGKCSEKTLRVKQLHSVDSLSCGNSVRGLVEVHLK